MDRLLIFDESGKEISNDVELVDGKANPWSYTSTFSYQGKAIGTVSNGHILLDKPYSYKVEEIKESD